MTGIEDTLYFKGKLSDSAGRMVLMVCGKCPSCGGILEVDQRHEAFICSYCGTPFITEKAICNYKIVNQNNIKNSVVNIYGNRDEPEELVKRAEDFLRIGDLESSLKTYREITITYPGDYRGWWGLIQYDIVNLIENINIFVKVCSYISEENRKVFRERILNYFIPNVSGYTLDDWEVVAKYCNEDIVLGHKSAKQYINSIKQGDEMPEFNLALLSDACGSEALFSWLVDYAIILDIFEDTSGLQLPCILGENILWKSNLENNWLKKSRIYRSKIKDIECGLSYWKKIVYRDENDLCLFCGGKFKFFSDECKKCGRKRIFDISGNMRLD